MKFFLYSLLGLLLTLMSTMAWGQKETDTVPVIKMELVKIEELEDDPTPIPNFDLKLFNIFVLDKNTVFYYYDPSFKIQKEFDEYRFENLKETFIHKSSFKDLKAVLSKLLRDSALAEERVILAVKENRSRIVRSMFQEIFNPLGIEHVGVGYITEELESLLRKKE